MATSSVNKSRQGLINHFFEYTISPATLQVAEKSQEWPPSVIKMPNPTSDKNVIKAARGSLGESRHIRLAITVHVAVDQSFIILLGGRRQSLIFPWCF